MLLLLDLEDRRLLLLDLEVLLLGPEDRRFVVEAGRSLGGVGEEMHCWQVLEGGGWRNALPYRSNIRAYVLCPT